MILTHRKLTLPLASKVKHSRSNASWKASKMVSRKYSSWLCPGKVSKSTNSTKKFVSRNIGLGQASWDFLCEKFFTLIILHSTKLSFSYLNDLDLSHKMLHLSPSRIFMTLDFQLFSFCSKLIRYIMWYTLRPEGAENMPFGSQVPVLCL